MPAEDMFSIGNIVENDTSENPVENAEEYELQYPLNVQVFGPFKYRMCLLYDKTHDNATLK